MFAAIRQYAESLQFIIGWVGANIERGGKECRPDALRTEKASGISATGFE
jgi:hypothetical protein